MSSPSGGDDFQKSFQKSLRKALQVRYEATCCSYVIPLLVILNLLTLVMAFFSWMS